ncbi:NADPH-dependent 7-cyano-7-deazaguanine reductase QueF [Aliikangiella coralliicola]|uniref:NADPH-dependent 7-cyano-7-deazaguanine reductase QueF n=1 Tax=Aliikangiella coralliicola TaxID=2592383 RepID=UPI001FE2FCF3|nr:NADPH-dependent 7-cyano-7-deazaguanine reductase QueF [Aliikangiella coralliicola]
MTENPLGKPTLYISQYSPELLFPIPRSEKRDELDSRFLQFNGEDVWNAYEISWLNPKGLPQVAIAEFRVSAGSEFIVESKSFKLYLNSFNQTSFESSEKVAAILTTDLSRATGKPVSVKLCSPQEFDLFAVSEFNGELIDHQDIEIDNYDYQPELLINACRPDSLVEETLVSHLLKSNCLITSQPDWASIQIRYFGPQIDRAKLLAYLVSFRSHNEFHEQCVERIFCDLKKFCEPQKLSVYARYTRRGGLDINPWRSDFEVKMTNTRLARQ